MKKHPLCKDCFILPTCNKHICIEKVQGELSHRLNFELPLNDICPLCKEANVVLCDMNKLRTLNNDTYYTCKECRTEYIIRRHDSEYILLIVRLMNETKDISLLYKGNEFAYADFDIKGII